MSISDNLFDAEAGMLGELVDLQAKYDALKEKYEPPTCVDCGMKAWPGYVNWGRDAHGMHCPGCWEKAYPEDEEDAEERMWHEKYDALLAKHDALLNALDDDELAADAAFGDRSPGTMLRMISRRDGIADYRAAVKAAARKGEEVTDEH